MLLLDRETMLLQPCVCVMQLFFSLLPRSLLHLTSVQRSRARELNRALSLASVRSARTG